MNAVNRNVYYGMIVPKMHVTAREFARCILIDSNRGVTGNEEGYNTARFDFSSNALLMHFNLCITYAFLNLCSVANDRKLFAQFVKLNFN